MCGISGFCDFNKFSSIEDLKMMGNKMIHRGSDNFGVSFTELSNFNIGFAHNRLSIIGLSENSNQPFFSNCGNYILCYNGEVYNFKEIQKELIKKGYDFNTSSDTEVILYALIEWGNKAINKFIGMFAFTFYNKKEEKLLIVRDRAGVKPLYYSYKNDLFLFSSELSGIRSHPKFDKSISKEALGLYFQYGYVPSPHSIYKTAKKLKPGSYLELNLKTKKETHITYWNVNDFYYNQIVLSKDEIQNELEKILISSFNYRMISDVPVGVFLSGGYDSSIVTAIIQANQTEKLKTFTIGFEEDEWDESKYADKVAKYIGTDHKLEICSTNEALSVIDLIPEILDEPLADQSVIPTFLVSKMAKKSVKVALSADGGDESFGGYNRYKSITEKFKKYRSISKTGIHNIGNAIIPNSKLKRKIELMNALSKNMSTYGGMVAKKFHDDDINKLIGAHSKTHESNFNSQQSFSTNDPLNDLMALEYKTYMTDNCLTKVDRCSMSVTLEVREPLLDHRIIEFAAGLSSHQKCKKQPKDILKQIAHKYLPKELMDRPKMGFSVPLSKWLKNELKELVSYYTNEDSINNEGIISFRYVNKIKTDFLSHQSAYNTQKLWSIIVFRMWYEKWK